MAGTTWPTLTAGQKARASDVESKFDWLEGDLVPMSGGNTTTGVYDLGTSTASWRFLHIAPTGGIMCSGATSLSFLGDGTVKLKNGGAINEFSTDGTLGDNSDSAVPTEKAVRTYADTKAGAIGMKEIVVSSVTAASMTSTGYKALYSVNTNGVIWGFAVISADSGAGNNGTIEVLLDGQTMLLHSVSSNATMSAAPSEVISAGNLMYMKDAFLTSTSLLDELQFPFKSSFVINVRKSAGSTITFTSRIKIATG